MPVAASLKAARGSALPQTPIAAIWMSPASFPHSGVPSRFRQPLLVWDVYLPPGWTKASTYWWKAKLLQANVWCEHTRGPWPSLVKHVSAVRDSPSQKDDSDEVKLHKKESVLKAREHSPQINVSAVKRFLSECCWLPIRNTVFFSYLPSNRAFQLLLTAVEKDGQR